MSNAAKEADGYEVEPRKGLEDKLGEKVRQILHEAEDYKIYVTRETGVRWTTFKPERATKLMPVTSSLARIKALQTGSLTRHKAINRQIALGLKQAFEGEPALARETLDNVGRSLQRYRLAYGRVRYLLSTYVVTGLICAAALSVEFNAWLDASEAQLLKAAAFGSLGGLFSVAMGLGKLSVDLDDPPLIRITLGASRAFFAGLSAVFLVLLIRANVVLGFVSPDEPFGVYALALAAGFSEHLVPGLIENLGNRIGLREHSQSDPEEARDSPEADVP